MSVMTLSRAKKITLTCFATALLSACSSPLKYEPRDEQSFTKSTSNKTGINLCRSPYIVKPGDTLSGIAVDCNVEMQEIAHLNHLLPPYIIYVKQELVLPIKQMEEQHSTEKKSVAKNTVYHQKTEKTQAKQTNNHVSSSTKPAKPVKKESTARAIELSDNKTSKTHTKSNSKSNKWQWPMQKGLSYKYLRDSAGLSVLEIYGVPGQRVKAVASGKVVYAGDGIINYGWMLVIKHDNDYMSIYAHNSALLVKEGDSVDAGQTVATMGATGNTKRPKLYLEARYQGRKIDIKKMLKP
ncbi:hypothetical protein JCM30760_13450 [Thiomicrorhabdus hydrogeniphila]